MAQGIPTLQDVFATVQDPQQVQQQLIAQQQKMFAQLQNPTQQVGAGLAGIAMRFARRFATGDKGNGFFHRLRSGSPAAPEVARAEHTQEAMRRAESATGEIGDDEDDQAYELRLLNNIRNELGDHTNPQTAGAVTARIAALTNEKFERSRLLEADEMVRAEAERKARSAELDADLVQLRIQQERQTLEEGEDGIHVFELPDGSRINRRVDDPEVNRLLEQGARDMGTEIQLRQAEIAAERNRISGNPPPARMTNAQVNTISAIRELSTRTLNAQKQLLDNPSLTGLAQSAFGLRDSLTRNGLINMIPGLDNKAYHDFLVEADAMRPLFQEIAAGNPSDRENEYFTRAVFDTSKSAEFNMTVIDGLLGSYADRLKLQYSSAMQNNQAIPSELLEALRDLGVDPASIDTSFTMADLNMNATQRLNQLEQANARAGGDEEESRRPSADAPNFDFSGASFGE